MAKRKPFRTYLSFCLMRMALRCDPDWVQYAALKMVKQRVEDHLREYAELGIGPYGPDGYDDHDEHDESEHIIVTFH